MRVDRISPPCSSKRCAGGMDASMMAKLKELEDENRLLAPNRRREAEGALCTPDEYESSLS